MAEAAAAAPPSVAYAAGAARGDWSHDPAQAGALAALDRIHAALSQPAPGRGLVARLFGGGTPEPVPGLYLWGGVGRGKTFLIDLLYAQLPLPEVSPGGRAPGDGGLGGSGDGDGKRRTHFHRFMRDVHAELRQHAGERDPIATIVRGWRRHLRLLLLDEFLVTDIGDAMLLARLLERMFAEGIVLVTTSNTPPANLYRDGLQRARFEPAIALLEAHCEVLELDGGTDYRLRALTRSPVWRAPLDDGSDAWLGERWRALGGGDAHRDCGIQVEGRRIPVRARDRGMAWFDFDALCEGPRAAADYIEIAREFHTVLLGGVPVLDGLREDAARRFLTLVDELYDRRVNLVATAAAAPIDIYTGERLAAPFERTESRLIEMQSAEYLTLPHEGGVAAADGTANGADTDAT